AQIICDLSVEEPKSVRPGQAKLCARGEIEKGRLLGLQRFPHPCPDEKRLSSCLRKPRRNREAVLADPSPPPLELSPESFRGCALIALASCGSTRGVSEPVVAPALLCPSDVCGSS